MADIELSTIDDLSTMGDGDKVFGYSAAKQDVGWFPSHLISRKGYACRRWDETLSTPVGEAYGNIDYLRDLPYLLGLGCYLVSDNREKRKLSATTHHQFADGSPAALDGTMGQYMWCWNTFYYATWQEGNHTYEAVSLDPIEGKKNYRIPEGGIPAFNAGVIDRDNNTLCSVVNSSERYRGGGGVALTDTQAAPDAPQTTMLGMPASNYSIVNGSSYARKRGEGWEGNWFVAAVATEVLFRVIFGTRHAQSAVVAEKDENGLFQGGLGAGVTGMSDWEGYNGTYPIIPTGAGVEFGDMTGSFIYNVLNADGSVRYAAPVPVFFGLKNFYGHLWSGVSGQLINAGQEVTEGFIAPSMYAGWNTGSVANMLKATELPRTSGYITRLSMNLFCGLPTAVGGSASTYFADYFYENTAGGSYGLRARWARGSSAYSTFAGPHCTYSHGTVTHAAPNRSVPLCYFKEDPVIEL